MRTWPLSLRTLMPSKRSGSMPKACKKSTGVSKCAHGGKVAQMHAWFETEWAGMAQVFRLRRYVKERDKAKDKEGDKEREEIVYGVANLPRKKATASRRTTSPLAHRKSSPLPSGCHLRRLTGI